ncbi:hypothetical protein MMC32_007423 [Xylographa parallela]|nr:hypothetical protein [Xylographa parallela]
METWAKYTEQHMRAHPREESLDSNQQRSTALAAARIDLSEMMRTVVEIAHPSNVLYLPDCCYASSMAVRRTKEVSAACAIDRTTPGAGHPGSFTRVLVRTLEKANGHQFTVAQLHGAMTRAFDENELSSHMLSENDEMELELVGFYQASEAILLVTLPVEVWTVLRGDPAYVFVAVVTSGNLMSEILLSLEGQEDWRFGIGGQRIFHLKETWRPRPKTLKVDL